MQTDHQPNSQPAALVPEPATLRNLREDWAAPFNSWRCSFSQGCVEPLMPEVFFFFFNFEREITLDKPCTIFSHAREVLPLVI